MCRVRSRIREVTLTEEGSCPVLGADYCHSNGREGRSTVGLVTEGAVRVVAPKSLLITVSQPAERHLGLPAPDCM